MKIEKPEKTVYHSLLNYLRKNGTCVLATVTSVKGSTPQIPGSSAIFGENGLLVGTIGGGATELEVTKIIATHFYSKESGYFSFNLNHNIEEEKGPICGGGMNILIDASPLNSIQVFEELTVSISERKHGILATFFTQTEQVTTISRYWLTKENRHIKSESLPEALLPVVTEMLNNPVAGDFREIRLSDSAGTVNHAFLELVLPQPLLLIAGAGHVGKALAHVCSLLDFEVVVWDERTEYANAENLPDAHQIFSGELAQMKKMLQPGKDTYVVIVTHGHAKDIEVLKAFISENVGYIGMMGSKRKIVLVHRMFLENGWATDEQWNRVHTPIGLEIGSKTVNEIAVSIAAQLIQEKNRK